MSRAAGWAVMLLLVVCTRASGAQEVILPADAATTVSVFEPAEPLHDAPTVRLRSSGARKVLLRWNDLAALANLRPTRAAVRLHVESARNPDGVDVTLHPLRQAWDAEVATWNERLPDEAWAAPGLLAGTDYDERPVGRVRGPDEGFAGWLEIPIDPQIVLEWLAWPRLNHGLVLTVVSPNQPGVDDLFTSAAAPAAELRPRLVVRGEPGAPEPPALALRRRLAAELRLPAHRNADEATLVVAPTPLLTEPLRLELTFAERTSGAAPAPPQTAVIAPGGPQTISIAIAAWPDGEYRTTLRELRDDGADTGALTRTLRTQTVADPAPPTEPVDVSGLTLLMVDDHLLASREGLGFRVPPAETFAITTGALAPGRIMQRGIGLTIEDDGTFVVRIRDMDRYGNDPREHLARSRDLVAWTLTPADAQAAAPGLRLVADTPEPQFRYYRPADGPVDLAQVRVRYTGYQPARWGDIELPARATFPVWERSTAEHLILRREPLTQDRYAYDEDDTGEWSNSNDNFAGQWRSADGQTLFYGQGRTVPRAEPMRIPWDNLGTANRLLVVWSTSDGIDWTPTWFDLPTTSDPVGYQHYGAQVWTAEGGRLYLAYLLAYDQAAQQIFLELARSRDGRVWHRLPGRSKRAANGPPGTWSFGHVHPVGAGVVTQGPWCYRLLGYSSNAPHFYHEFIYNRDDVEGITADWLRRRYAGRRLTDWPFWPAFGSWEALAAFAPQASQTVGLMRYRRDGWACLDSGEGSGSLTTRALRSTGSLSINTRTRQGGRVRVELLDVAGRPLPGCSGADAAVFEGDAVDAPVVWPAGKALPAQPFRLRIDLHRAELFSLQF